MFLVLGPGKGMCIHAACGVTKKLLLAVASFIEFE
jgi:hypothetical protein